MTGRFSVQDLDRRLIDLERKNRAVTTTAGTVAAMGAFSLTADGVAISTTVANAHVSASSVIMFVPSNAGGWSADGALNGITPGAGSFSVSHQASTLARSYSYVVINPA